MRGTRPSLLLRLPLPSSKCYAEGTARRTASMHMKHRVIYLLGPEHIEIREEPVPTPGAGELLVRIRAATTCGTDVKVFRRGGHPRMLQVPTPFGHEFAGSVEKLGPGVSGVPAGGPRGGGQFSALRPVRVLHGRPREPVPGP